VAGLHHVAIRYPTRAGLADALRRLREVDWPIRQATDHGTHEAIYISDPDGNDLELCWDRAPEEWPRTGEEYARAQGELDLDRLAAEA
jgi:catechol 2,3-dioxygenase